MPNRDRTLTGKLSRANAYGGQQLFAPTTEITYKSVSVRDTRVTAPSRDRSPMEDTSKYLIHADVTADGIVERSDVVGAIFGQTEGLLGDELDLRDLRQSSKVGRIDVEITSTAGQSHGQVTIATSLDKVETATLAAALETITRVGPCRADLEVRDRGRARGEAKRSRRPREGTAPDGVRRYDHVLRRSSPRGGAPAGPRRRHHRVRGTPRRPRVTDSDAIIVVEGRADVLSPAQITASKNAIAVEGRASPTPWPNSLVTAPSRPSSTATAAATSSSRNSLSGRRPRLRRLRAHRELRRGPEPPRTVRRAPGQGALRRDRLELNEPRDAIAATDGSTTPAPPPSELSTASPTTTEPDDEGDLESSERAPDSSAALETPSAVDPERAATSRAQSGASAEEAETESERTRQDEAATDAESDTDRAPETVYGHATAVIRAGTDSVRFLDAEADPIDDADASARPTRRSRPSRPCRRRSSSTGSSTSGSSIWRPTAASIESSRARSASSPSGRPTFGSTRSTTSPSSGRTRSDWRFFATESGRRTENG